MLGIDSSSFLPPYSEHFCYVEPVLNRNRTDRRLRGVAESYTEDRGSVDGSGWDDMEYVSSNSVLPFCIWSVSDCGGFFLVRGLVCS